MAKIYGLGTGPGHKEYLTLKAVRVLAEVDYIFVPNNRGKNMALDTVRDFIDESKIVFLDFPMGQTTDETYKENGGIIEKLLGKEKSGAFITIGDPMFYSTVLNTFSKLNKTIEVEFVSGIPSFVAAAAVSKKPLALVGESLAIVDSFPEDLNKDIDSYAILKTNNLDERKLDLLKSSNFDYKYIVKATLDDEKILEKDEDILSQKAYISLFLARRKK